MASAVFSRDCNSNWRGVVWNTRWNNRSTRDSDKPASFASCFMHTGSAQ